MHRPLVPNASRRRVKAAGIRRLALTGAIAAFALAACGGASTSAIPTVVVPSNLPQVAVTVEPGASGGTACVDAATLAVIDQLKAAGADVQALLTANKDTLVKGLQAMQVNDPTTTTWKSDFVAAVQAGDSAKVTTLLGQIDTDIKITTC
jgi:hypothetical protein